MESVVSGHLVDLDNRRIYPAEVDVVDGRIGEVREVKRVDPGYLLPGFVDSHVHVESSMLPPAEFARMAVRHGTVATVSDPHEIANVLGIPGIDFMLESASHRSFKFCFGAPSCVPATKFETAGAELGVEEVTGLLDRPEIGYLSEVMNFPAVLSRDPEMMAKIAAAVTAGKPVDGHAPGLRGEQAAKYAAAGIQTDHECTTLEEALDKIAAGMWISIREGSAAKNFAALESLLRTHPQHCMLCTDDLHPNALVRGHMNRLAARALAGGAELFDVLRCAHLHPVEHYGLRVGRLRPGDPADWIRVADLTNFEVLETWIEGVKVAGEGRDFWDFLPSPQLRRCRGGQVGPEGFRVRARQDTTTVRVIEVEDGQLVTGAGNAVLQAEQGWMAPNPEMDVLKIAVVNRYAEAPPALGFIRGFGLKRGAIASTVAHDSHNLVAVGTSDEALAGACNKLLESGGGVCATDGSRCEFLPLPIAGLMSNQPGDGVAADYERVAGMARSLGSNLQDPFMTLSFMALLVIPDLKLSDRGLFSGASFAFQSIEEI